MPFGRKKDMMLERFEKSWRDASLECGMALLRNLRQFEHKLHTGELKKRLERYLDMQHGHLTKKQKLSGDFGGLWLETAGVAIGRLEQDLRLGRFHLQLAEGESRNELVDNIIEIVKNTMRSEIKYDTEQQTFGKEFEKTGNPAADKMLGQGTSNMLRLSRLREQIDCPEIKSQIRHLLATSSQIFEFISKNPEKARKLHEFMDYYFPTTLKLLETYIELDSKPTKGENIRNTLEQISNTTEKIEQAFDHQLDTLFSDTTLDIKTDIIALENIMKQAGL
jgi:5-bromo-4-chloroindolyl phosphate hydrolysis protein